MKKTIAIFGESEKGRFHYPYMCSTLIQLSDFLGNSLQDSSGITLAVQAIMYERDIIFFRVQEEGYSIEDYMAGFECLLTNNKIKNLAAIYLPKVSDHQIIESTDRICNKFKSILVTTKKDLFDYLISR